MKNDMIMMMMLSLFMVIVIWHDNGCDDAVNDDDYRDKLYVVMMHDIVGDQNIKKYLHQIKLSIIIMIITTIIFSYTIEASLNLFVHLQHDTFHDLMMSKR